MKQPENQSDVENVVMFPASAHFDHLEDTFSDMDEYSELKDPDHAKIEFSSTSSLEKTLIDELAGHSNEEQQNFYLSTLKDDLKYLKEAQQRIKFYLDELEIFIPKK
ncbi:hypothetical protein OAT67_03465 [Bacteriovoracaceae bacterium]|nr:hypothetical protein [Bacteriovoracaceae bacterium]